MSFSYLIGWFNLDPLSEILIALVALIAVMVSVFAGRYLRGDQHYGRFMFQLWALFGALITLLSADDLRLFFVAWCTSHGLLVVLMVHESQWQAAQASGRLTSRSFLLAGFCLAAGFTGLYWSTHQISIQAIMQENHSILLEDPVVVVSLGLILLSAMVQSAIWPFHRWLLSSLNSPTPVSAMMHAGLINGGGFLLARFAPLYGAEPRLLSCVFIIGILTALLGTAWKLMQSDIKRMLACSTMSQMGFMLAQCGLGLFPAAVAHLCWHGLFKAYLFLNSASAAQDKRGSVTHAPSLVSFLLSLLCGALGAYGFMLSSGKNGALMDTSWILIGVAFVACVQFALTVLRYHPFKSLLPAALLTVLGGLLYGLSVGLINSYLAPLQLSFPQPLNAIHLVGFGCLLGAWCCFFWVPTAMQKKSFLSENLKRFYVFALNASQPHPTTITTHRNHYHCQ